MRNVKRCVLKLRSVYLVDSVKPKKTNFPADSSDAAVPVPVLKCALYSCGCVLCFIVSELPIMTAPSGPPDPSAIHVLAIHAHPDDIEFQCAGTLLRLKKLGCRISVATMTPGDGGSAVHSPDEIAAIRRGEAQAAADILQASYTCLEFRDLSICFDNDSRRRVTEFVRRQRPDIILTAPPVDYMHDHEITSALVRDACFNASVPNYRTQQWDPAPPASRIPWLYYVDPVEGMDHFGRRQPVDLIVDVTSVYETKRQALACHSSQREWLRRQHGIDEYMDACDRWSRARGQEQGFLHGEGFRQYKGHPHPGNNILSELLPG
jgi:LmbE family N-acetylglucosaminyl deacetylase